MRISDWSSDVCSSDLIEAANDNQKQDENAADTAQRADPIAPVDPRPGWSDLGPAVSHYGDRGSVAQNPATTGNNARNEELSNIGFGQHAVDNQDDAGRDENPEGSAGRDGPGRQAVRIMVAPHQRHGQTASR